GGFKQLRHVFRYVRPNLKMLRGNLLKLLTARYDDAALPTQTQGSDQSFSEAAFIREDKPAAKRLAVVCGNFAPPGQDNGLARLRFLDRQSCDTRETQLIEEHSPRARRNQWMQRTYIEVLESPPSFGQTKDKVQPTLASCDFQQKNLSIRHEQFVDI